MTKRALMIAHDALDDMGRAADRAGVGRAMLTAGMVDLWVARAWMPDGRALTRAEVAAFFDGRDVVDALEAEGLMVRDGDAWRPNPVKAFISAGEGEA